MKNGDFSKKIKEESLKRSGFKCERCWSSQDLVFHHKIPVYAGGTSFLDNCIVLCSNCHSVIPDDEVILKMFMEFASPKEMIKYYRVKTEVEAIEKWCRENDINISGILGKLKTTSHKSSVFGGMDKKARKGGLCGFNAPFGYNFKNGNLEIVEKEGKVVKQIFNKYDSGKTLMEIVGYLNSDGIKTKRNNSWSIWSVRRILKNPIYAGYVRWNNIIKKGQHPPLIEPKQFNQLQMRMDKRSIRKPRSKVFLNDG